MNVVSLFTGVGGFDLGLERAGHRIVAQCEADERARAVLRRHWPDVPIHEDVCGFDAEWCERQGIRTSTAPTYLGKDNREQAGIGQSDSVREIRISDSITADSADLVCGGFPCQDLSVAGKRAGLAGERSGLFFEAARISDLILGDGGWILIENVPGLLSSNGGRDFAVVLATLADLGFHDLAWRVLDSRFFGVPQRRRRVFILARRSRGRRAASVLLEPESGGGNHQASRKAGARVAGTSCDGAEGTVGVAPTLNTSGPQTNNQSIFSQRGGHLIAGALTKRYGKGINTTADDGAMVISPPPDSDGVRAASGIPGRVDDSVTHSLTTRWTAGEDGGGRGTPLTVGHTDSPAVTCAIDLRPDGPRYAQMGNAVTVNVAEWIGHRLREFG